MDQSDADRKRSKAIAIKLLARYFPGFDPYNPSFLDAAIVRHQKYLIEGLEPYRDKDNEIEQAIQEAIKRQSELPHH